MTNYKYPHRGRGGSPFTVKILICISRNQRGGASLSSAMDSFSHNYYLIYKFILFFFLSSFRNCPLPACATNVSNSSARIHSVRAMFSSLQSTPVGVFEFGNLSYAAEDFGGMDHYLPSAVLHPKSQSDIAITIREFFRDGQVTNLTVAARGNGHSIQGQAQALAGVVINMRSLDYPPIRVDPSPQRPYVDVSAGQLWMEVLNETLRYGLTPKSWTDYIHLTVGGTLSNAGISGQAFKYGPQISNVYQLEVVTGRGEIVTCSESNSTDLFHAVLGGLGQFGVITRAIIPLQPAPSNVKRITARYADFAAFSKDQELLISSSPTFDYIEGFVVFNSTSHTPIFTIEVVKYIFGDEKADSVNQTVANLLSPLHYIPSSLNVTEESYLGFLDRVHTDELKLRESGAWDVPHPWLNLMIPRTQIQSFVAGVFGKIVTDTNNGLIIIYPVNQSTWNDNTSVVVPAEDVFYLVSVLPTILRSPSAAVDMDRVLKQNRLVLEFCKKANIMFKEYLPHYEDQAEWKNHFGGKWAEFARRKSTYDPFAILAPAHKIFQRSQPIP